MLCVRFFSKGSKCVKRGIHSLYFLCSLHFLRSMDTISLSSLARVSRHSFLDVPLHFPLRCCLRPHLSFHFPSNKLSHKLSSFPSHHICPSHSPSNYPNGCWLGSPFICSWPWLQRLLAHFYVEGPDAVKFNEVFKSLDQKVDDLIDCLPSNGVHDEENVQTESQNSIANCNANNPGVNEQTESAAGSSQAALDGETKDDGKNGNKTAEGDGGVTEPSNSVCPNEVDERDTGITYWEKLQGSLKPNLPRDLQSSDGQSVAQAQVQEQALAHFWAFLRGLLIPTS